MFRRLRIKLLKSWIRWRCRKDASRVGFFLLRLDDATLAALGLRRDTIRRELLHLDEDARLRDPSGAPSDDQT